MSTPKELIESGLLESYLLGLASPEEIREIEAMAAAFSEVAEEIEQIAQALEHYAMANAIQPDPAIKVFVTAVVDYASRRQEGEELEEAPLLSARSKATDFEKWLKRPDMQLKEPLENLYVKVISYTPAVLTAIVWARHYTPPETHHDQYEHFLILEGSCDIIIEQEVHKLSAGDFLRVPLHQSHKVKVTSAVPCKVIVQRVAA